MGRSEQGQKGPGGRRGDGRGGRGREEGGGGWEGTRKGAQKGRRGVRGQGWKEGGTRMVVVVVVEKKRGGGSREAERLEGASSDIMIKMIIYCVKSSPHIAGWRRHPLFEAAARFAPRAGAACC